MTNSLYYGDNLEVLRKHIRDETVDLCYIDPPFNSKRNYNQIYNNIGVEDRAQARAFTDTWVWDDVANEGLQQILENYQGRFTAQSVDLVNGLRGVLKEGSLLAYLVSMTLRIAEIFRVLKPTGTFYLHCDPTAGHYLKLVLDSIFVGGGGMFRNEIVWCYRGGGVPRKDFARKHDTIFRYTKTRDNNYTFNLDEVRTSYSEDVLSSLPSRYDKSYRSNKVYEGYRPNPKGKHPEDWWPIQPLMPSDNTERLGYPTQKPRKLLEPIIKASSNEGEVVLDAYCGCGTSIVVAEQLKRKWIGMDITYQSISLVLQRLEDIFGASVSDSVVLNGIPQDMDSAVALAHKKDDRVRKEFEKWAVLTYTRNRAIINEKKGADKGIDAVGYFQTAKRENAKIIFQVKSGGVGRGAIATLRGDMAREKAELAVLITLEKETAPMKQEASAIGQYRHDVMGRNYNRIEIVTIEEILSGSRLDIPMSVEVLRAAQRDVEDKQMALSMSDSVPAEAPKTKATASPAIPAITPALVSAKKKRGRPRKPKPILPRLPIGGKKKT